jgi:hypothetical protein
MKKTIIVLILILSSSALAEKEWVQKQFNEDDELFTIQCHLNTILYPNHRTVFC